MELPEKILIKDLDDGYIKAKLDHKRDLENADEEFIPIYIYVEYYHDLSSAIRDF